MQEHNVLAEKIVFDAINLLKGKTPFPIYIYSQKRKTAAMLVYQVTVACWKMERYHIAGKFDRELNLAVWRSRLKLPN